MKLMLSRLSASYRIVGFWVFSMGLMIYLITFNSLSDSLVYNSIDLSQASLFVVKQVENKGGRKKFPHFFMEGQIFESKRHYQYQISRGEFESTMPGDTIIVYETPDKKAIISQYSINNSKPFIKLFGYFISIYVLGEVLIFCCMFVVFLVCSKKLFSLMKGEL